MRKDLQITSENFDRLLDWLDADRSQAAVLYESIRTRLIRIFSCRGCFDAEDMADETFNRVIRKINELKNSVDKPVPYFYGVASKIYLEWSRDRRRFSELQPETADGKEDGEPDDEREHRCLDRCLDELSVDQRSLVLEYYRGERSEKIENRRKIATGLKMSANALQVKVLRIRTALKACVNNCLRDGI